MNKRLTGLSPAARPKLHPRTGQPLVPIGVVNGKVIWPILGASEDEGSNSGATTDKPDDGGAGTGSEGEQGSNSSGDEKDPQRKIAALEEEKDRHFQKAKKAEQERDELAQRLKAIEDKDKDELTRATEKTAELESTIADLNQQLSKARLQNAFLSDNTYQWYDPEDALRLADLSDVEVNDDGSVKGLKKALEALAKSKPHLVKPAEGTGDGPPKSGDPAHGKQKDKGELDAEALRKKYPALRR